MLYEWAKLIIVSSVPIRQHLSIAWSATADPPLLSQKGILPFSHSSSAAAPPGALCLYNANTTDSASTAPTTKGQKPKRVARRKNAPKSRACTSHTTACPQDADSLIEILNQARSLSLRLACSPLLSALDRMQALLCGRTLLTRCSFHLGALPSRLPVSLTSPFRPVHWSFSGLSNIG